MINFINQNKGRIIFDRDYKKYLGSHCSCGYSYDEGDYQLKGRVDDFVKYNCDNCNDRFTVRLYRNISELEVDSHS